MALRVFLWHSRAGLTSARLEPLVPISSTLTRRCVYERLQAKTLSYRKNCLLRRQAICHVKVRYCCFLHAGSFLGLNSESEDGGDMFLKTFGWPLTKDTVFCTEA
jgi:hypothetical protein